MSRFIKFYNYLIIQRTFYCLVVTKVRVVVLRNRCSRRAPSARSPLKYTAPVTSGTNSYKTRNYEVSNSGADGFIATFNREIERTSDR